MNLKDPIRLVSQLLDLPIIDRSERWCGIVDDVELEGSPGKSMRVRALLVGPGAYEGRVPAWLYWIISRIAGKRLVRIPANQITQIGAVVKLKSDARAIGLHGVEDKVRSWIPHEGAM